MLFTPLFAAIALQVAPQFTSSETYGDRRFLHESSVDALALNAQEDLLLTAGGGGELSLWQAETGERLGTCQTGITRTVMVDFWKEDMLVLGDVLEHLHIYGYSSEGAMIKLDPFELGIGDLVDMGGAFSLAEDGESLVVWIVGKGQSAVVLADLTKKAQDPGARVVLDLEGFHCDDVVWSADGKRIAVMGTNLNKVLKRLGTAEEDFSRIFIFDRASGSKLSSISVPDEPLAAIGFGPTVDGGLMVGGGRQGIVLWELETGRKLTQFGGGGHVIDLKLSADTESLLVTDRDGAVEHWVLSSESEPKLVLRRELMKGIDRMVRSDNGHVFGIQGRRIQRWKIDTWSESPKIDGHGGYLAAMDAQGESVLSLGMDGSLVLWDLQTSKGRSFRTGHAGLVFDVGLAPDGKRMVTAGQDGTVRVVEPGAGPVMELAEVFTWTGRGKYAFTNVDYSPDGSVIAAVSADGMLWIWDSTSGTLLRTFEGLNGLRFKLEFSADGSRLVVGGADMRVWDTTSWDLVAHVEGFKSPLSSLAVSADGKWAAAGMAAKTVKLVDVQQGAIVRTSKSMPARVTGLAFVEGGLVVTSDRMGGAQRLNLELAEQELLRGEQGLDFVLLVNHGSRLFAGDRRGMIASWKTGN